MNKAIQSVDERASGIIEEWIRLVEIPAPSGKEQARAKYIRAEMEKIGLSDIRTDDLFNVSGVRKGTGGGPTVVFAAHMDTVFPEGTDLKVKREGDILRAPGVGRRYFEPDGDARNVPRARPGRREDQGRPDLPRIGSGGARAAWRQALAGEQRLQAGHVRRRGRLGGRGLVRRAAHRPVQVLLHLPGAHTMESRGAPSPAKAVAKAINAVYEIPLPPVAEGLGDVQTADAERGDDRRRHGVQRDPAGSMVHGGPAVARQRALRTGWRAPWLRRPAGSASRKASASAWRRRSAIDYSKARPQRGAAEPSAGADGARHAQPLPQARARRRSFPADVGSTDANIAVGMGIPGGGGRGGQ